MLLLVLLLGFAASAGQEGSIARTRVEDEGDGKTCPGYSFDDGTPVTGDGLALPVRWGDRETLPEAKRQGIAVDIEIKNAAVYAMNFDDETL